MKLNPIIKLKYSTPENPDAHIIYLIIGQKETPLLSFADKNVAEHVYKKLVLFHKTINQCDTLNENSIKIKDTYYDENFRGMNGVIVKIGSEVSDVVIEGYKGVYTIPNEELEY